MGQAKDQGTNLPRRDLKKCPQPEAGGFGDGCIAEKWGELCWAPKPGMGIYPDHSTSWNGSMDTMFF